MDMKASRLLAVLMLMTMIFAPIVSAKSYGSSDIFTAGEGKIAFSRTFTAKSYEVLDSCVYFHDFRWVGTHYSLIGFRCVNPATTITFSNFDSNVIVYTISGGTNGVSSNSRVYLPIKIDSVKVTGVGLVGYGWNADGLVSVMVNQYPCVVTITINPK